MPIRVIAGSAKGRKLKLVPGDSTRPIMDRAKEALFSIIGQSIVDATIIDLFAGTGSVGIEALSRGAKHATFIDLDRKAISTVRDNLAATKLEELATVRLADAFSLMKQNPDRLYDYIYIAPPQYKEIWLRLMQELDNNTAWLSENTTVIVQIDPHEFKAIELNNLALYDQRKYGKTMLLFYETTSPEE